MDRALKEEACEAQIRTVVSDLFRTMLQMEVALTSQEQSHAVAVTATIKFDGPWKGILELGCSNVQAHCFAERFLQMSLSEFDEEVHDTVGELANIIAGQLKQLLPAKVSLGTPTVVRGPGDSDRTARGELVGAYSFASEVGLFSVRVVQGAGGVSE